MNKNSLEYHQMRNTLKMLISPKKKKDLTFPKLNKNKPYSLDFEGTVCVFAIELVEETAAFLATFAKTLAFF